MRFSIRRLSIYITAIFLLLFIYVSLNYSNFQVNYRDYSVHDAIGEDSFKRSDRIIREEIHYTNYEFSLQEEFFRTHVNDDFKSKSLSEKCGTFFDYFLDKDPDWKFKTFEDATFEKNIVNKLGFFKMEWKKLADQKKEQDFADPIQVTKEENNTINKLFVEKLKDTKMTENNMADTTTLLRIYGQCYVHGQGLGNEEKHQEIFSKYSKKLFPYFTGKLPKFERLNETGIENGFPIIEGGYNHEEHIFDGKNIIDFIKRYSNGKGIVVSATSKHTRELIKLIHLLRALNNVLPIQIIFKGDLNRRGKQHIMNAARDDMNVIIDPMGKAKQKPNSSAGKLLNNAEKYGSHFPKQEVWFVDLQGTIGRKYKNSFPGYTNKILALLFTSFKEVLLLDADTVPLVPLEDFFKTKQYEESSTMFFKDRSLRDINDFIETNYFAKLSPTNIRSIDSLFGINPITNYTLANSYMTGYRHYQEAGVVGINKLDHFTGILMMLPLVTWKEPVKGSIWGDKEMYWLGLSIAGDENYQFNKYAAASIGEITTNPNHKLYLGTNAKELCSSHPGHINEDGDLLWINSGFKYCKKNTYYRDREKFPFTVFDPKELSNLFDNPLKIKHAIIPPDSPVVREPGSPVDDANERLIKQLWKARPQDVDEVEEKSSRFAQIKNGNPQKGWNKNPVCTSYQYCAYDLIDRSSQDGGSQEQEQGNFFEFSDELTSKYDYLGQLWFNAKIRSSPRN